MTRRLVARVTLEDPDTRQHVSFGPGGEVPGWAAALITNPRAWAEATIARAFDRLRVDEWHVHLLADSETAAGVLADELRTPMTQLADIASVPA